MLAESIYVDVTALAVPLVSNMAISTFGTGCNPFTGGGLRKTSHSPTFVTSLGLDITSNRLRHVPSIGYFFFTICSLSHIEELHERLGMGLLQADAGICLSPITVTPSHAISSTKTVKIVTIIIVRSYCKVRCETHAEMHEAVLGSDHKVKDVKTHVGDTGVVSKAETVCEQAETSTVSLHYEMSIRRQTEVAAHGSLVSGCTSTFQSS